VKQISSSMTPKGKDERAQVPEYAEPMLGDEIRHINQPYTQTRGKGALPDEVVVIPDTDSMYTKAEYNNIFDLYEVGGLRNEETSLPFVHGVELAGPQGEIVRFRSVFDDGALVNAIDETMYLTSKGRLTALTPSGKIPRMADGRRVPSIGLWSGRVTVGGVHRDGIFEVFNSNGAWAMLFGKPLLKAFNAIHDYTEDTIRILQTGGTEWTVLTNQFTNTRGVAGKLLANLTVDIKQLIKLPQPSVTAKMHAMKPMGNKEAKEQKECHNAYKLRGGFTTPLEGSPIYQPSDTVEPHSSDIIISSESTDNKHMVMKSVGNEEAKEQKKCHNTYELRGGFTTPLEGSPIYQPSDIVEAHSSDNVISSENTDNKQHMGEPSENWTSVWLLDEAAGKSLDHPGTEQPDITKVFEPSILTKKTHPHVAAILAEVTIGQDLTPAQTELVRNLISEYAECFALSMSEVTKGHAVSNQSQPKATKSASKGVLQRRDR
jgi:hypothetical protein